MGEHGPITAFAAWKSAEKYQDAAPEERGESEHCPQLNDNAIHLPKPISKVDPEERFCDSQMRRRTNRQEFGQPFDGAEQDREKIVVHAARKLVAAA
jgi:hypothetical protein